MSDLSESSALSLTSAQPLLEDGMMHFHVFLRHQLEPHMK